MIIVNANVLLPLDKQAFTVGAGENERAAPDAGPAGAAGGSGHGQMRAAENTWRSWAVEPKTPVGAGRYAVYVSLVWVCNFRLEGRDKIKVCVGEWEYN